jgi:tetratricopeptide (TPR) repeat protein
LLVLGVATVSHQDSPSPKETPPPPNVFEIPQILAKYRRLQSQAQALLLSGKYPEAEKGYRDLVQLVPYDVLGHYNLACALARQEKYGEALKELDRAVDLGFNQVKHLKEDKDLAGLQGREGFQKILDRAATAKPDKNAGWKFSWEPGLVQDGVAKVTAKDTVWDQRLGLFRVFFRFPEKGDKPIVKGFGDVGPLLWNWNLEGTAAGNHGDLYDNHDGGHSTMHLEALPQLSRIQFGDEPKAKGFHYGLQLLFLYNAPTVGNSSTAQTHGVFWRSQGRSALTRPQGPLILYLQYINNHLYVYPEHRDHDPGRNGDKGQGHGDTFPANVPYYIMSQGSSGSDAVFLNAVAATLAALRPEVKTALVRAGALMPTVQMIFRSSNKNVRKPEDYLTGKAHPTVFDGTQVDPVRMVRMAHRLTTESLPPLIQLKVIEEDKPVVGVDFCDVNDREKFFDTPAAIARVVLSLKYQRRMVISAENSRDLKGKPLTYRWVVLRGNAERIKIKKLNEAGTAVELLIPYHERRPVEPGAELESNRVDIGAFAYNGEHYSAPGFISLYYFDNEKRVYDDQQRIKVVDYADPAASKNYVDPLLDLRKNWRDEFQYDASGQLLGWTRLRGTARERFTAGGALVTKTDDRGQPLETKKVRYVAQTQPNQAPVLQQQE